MKRFSTVTAIAIATAALGLSAPAAAQDQGLACIEGQYTQEQRDQVAALGAEMDGGMAFFQPVIGQLAGAITPAIGACVQSEGWTQEQTQFATIAEMGRQGAAALRAHGTLTADELARFDAALADPANADVMPAVMRLVGAGMGGSGEPSADDGEKLGQFVSNAQLEIGNAGTNTGELTTMLLIFIALQNMGEMQFAAMAATAQAAE